MWFSSGFVVKIRIVVLTDTFKVSFWKNLVTSDMMSLGFRLCSVAFELVGVLCGSPERFVAEFDVIGLSDLLGPSVEVRVVLICIIIRRHAFKLSIFDCAPGLIINEGPRILIVDLFIGIGVLVGRLAVKLILRRDEVFVDVVVAIVSLGL